MGKLAMLLAMAAPHQELAVPASRIDAAIISNQKG